MTYKYQLRGERRRVTKPPTPKQIHAKWKKKYGHLFQNNAIQLPTEAQSKDAAARHHALMTAGAVRVQDAYMLSPDQYGKVDTGILVSSSKGKSLREMFAKSDPSALVETDLAAVEDRVAMLGVDWATPGADRTVVITYGNPPSESQYTEAFRRHREGRCLRKEARIKAKALSFGTFYGLGARVPKP